MKMSLKILGALALCLLLIQAFTEKTFQAEETYSNPVLVETITISRNSPDNFSGVLGIGDPSVILHDGTYYLYPTGDNHGYDVYISADLVNWSKGPRVFTSSKPGVWAPDVFYNPDDRKFYLYYTVNRQIGVAVADQPDGTFTDRRILVEGAIDAHMFQDEDGKYYLYYVTYPGFRIYAQPMESPTIKNDRPIEILSPSEPWEKRPYPLTEAPWMLKHKGTYYLLYSGGGADTQDYAIGYATSKNPMGPFTRYTGNPIMQKGDGIFGPGHASVTKDRKGNLWMVYHQQRDGSGGWDRIICIDHIWFDDRGALHVKATRGVPQPLPVTIKQHIE
jgi:xylan 1,4-beta-xylosidase